MPRRPGRQFSAGEPVQADPLLSGLQVERTELSGSRTRTYLKT